jgi:hypothetical protein
MSLETIFKRAGWNVCGSLSLLFIYFRGKTLPALQPRPAPPAFENFEFFRLPSIHSAYISVALAGPTPVHATSPTTARTQQDQQATTCGACNNWFGMRCGPT